ncbi:Uncharacterised protein [Campylobacter sputorum subsp. bubulus]|nr:Uncharacterised protein [Campylobacter sputorum subsp. bubulus]
MSEIHEITKIYMFDYNFLMGLTGILCGFLLCLIVFIFIGNLR